jgi:hypothetical protein
MPSPRLSKDFLEAIQNDFVAIARPEDIPDFVKAEFTGQMQPLTKGQVAIAIVRRKRPATYAQIVSSAIPKEVVLSAGDDLATFLEQVQTRRFELASSGKPAIEHKQVTATDPMYAAVMRE